MQLYRAALLGVVAAAATLISGCATANELWVGFGDTRYVVEVADDNQERARGLMFRDQMPADHGMLFIHDREEPQAYWMMNTRIPLDILYFDGNRRLVSQQRDVPPCLSRTSCPAYPSNEPALYVLELNAGQAAKLGLKDGTMLQFGPGIAVP